MKKKFSPHRFIAVTLLSIAIIASVFVAAWRPSALGAEGEAVNVYSSREWKFANTGVNAKGSHKVNADGSVTISCEKGKIADSEESFAFYYTEIDAAAENFTLTATFKVDECSKKDNQSGFGIICVDTVGAETVGKYMNYASAGAFKLSGEAAGYNIPGARFVTGYIDQNAASPTETADGTGTSLRVTDMDNGFTEPTDMFGTNTSWTFTLRKSNTGYHASMKYSDKEYVLYGANKLLVQDEHKVYVGFFASRELTVTVSDVVMTVIAPEKDEKKQEAPVESLPTELMVYSRYYTSSREYNYIVRPNYDGILRVEDPQGNEIIADIEVKAYEYFERVITLPDERMTTLVTKFTPSSALAYPITDRTLVTYGKYGKENQVVYAGNVTEDGNGTREKPYSVYTALRFAQKGQTIVVLNGTYMLDRKLTIERGADGTAEQPITLMAETEGGVIFDCAEMNVSSGEAFLIYGNYWRVYGFELKNSQGNAKGIRVGGSYNVLERLNVHHNGNTGIQISGSSAEPFEKWPHDNLIKNCDSSFNCDPQGQDADGFAAKLTAGKGNVFYGCVANNNIDDGYDLYAKSISGSIGAVRIENCVAYQNGYLDINGNKGEGNGFKLGGENMPGAHELINCVAFSNGAKGITSNSGPNCKITNCTAFNNNVFGTIENFSLYTQNATITTDFEAKGVISYSKNAKADKYAYQKQELLLDDSVFVFDGEKSVNKSGLALDLNWFESIDTTLLPTRNEDGTLNMHGLLVLKSSAPIVSGAKIDTSEKAASVAPKLPEGSSISAWLFVAVFLGAVAIFAGVCLIIKRQKSKKQKS